MAARSINPTSRSLAGLSNGDPAPAGMTPGWWVDAAGNVAAIVSQPVSYTHLTLPTSDLV